MSEEELLKEAFSLRYHFFNTYENKENKWHEKYKDHQLYEIVIESFDYKFHEIANTMPKLLQKIK